MKTKIIAVLLFVLGLLGYDSAYTVSEVEQVIVTQFGEPVGDPVVEPGLHFKLPRVQKINRFDKRWLEWDGDANEMPTKEKTYIWVDTYARWRISDPLQFFKSVRDERGAQSRLDDIISGETRNVIAAYELKEVVRLTNRELPPNTFRSDMAAEGAVNEVKREAQEEEGQDKEGQEDARAQVPADERETTDERITQGREKLTQLILHKAQAAMPAFGIELVDIQFQRVNYTATVEAKVFERMVSERKRIAEFYRSEGKGENARIRGEMDRELKQIESDAYRQVQEIMGDGDAQATAIYAEAHNRDPKLYRLVKSLEGLDRTIDDKTWVLLSSESDFFAPLSSIE